MSQPPIDPTPEQPNPEQPAQVSPFQAPAASEAPQFAPPQAPAAPAAPQYGQPVTPQAPNYNQPPTAPQAPQFAPPQAPAAPQARAFGQPAAPQYGQPAAPSYGPPQFGQPQAPYGQPGQPQYGAPAYAAQLQFPAAPVGTVPGPGGYFDGAQSADDLTRPLYGASFGEAVKRFFKLYAGFSGRASRSEYWWVALFTFLSTLIPVLIMIIGAVVMGVSSNYDSSSYDGYTYNSAPSGPGIFIFFLGYGLVFLMSLAILVPSIAITWRRLHDINFPGPLFFLMFIPSAGALALFVFSLLPSKTEGRRFDAVNR